MQTNNTDTDGVDRRTVLKNVGASAGLIGLSGLANASSTESIGTVDLVQVGVEYQFDEPFELQEFLINGTPGYFFDSAEKSMYLTSAVSPTEKSAFQSRATIVKQSGLGAMKEHSLGNESTTVLPTALDDSTYRPIAVLGLEEPFQEPGVEITPEAGAATISTGSFKTALQPNTEQTTEVDEHTITVKAYEVSDDLVDAPHIPKNERSVNIDRWQQEIDVTRVLRAKYLEDISVVDLSTLDNSKGVP
ncbi:hypothetical protein [Halorussus aquaticus]|uniref:Tat (Twin-arginine translocation) pathway signal sequence n=1 Tax=Halorussus aquaticus TaxID=2953748 RepID=A0ABD5Q701_9EURY|nr:hypothetical protein [Halorussus aquaticus]